MQVLQILRFWRFVSNRVFEMAEFEFILVLWIFMYFMCNDIYVAGFEVVHLLRS